MLPIFRFSSVDEAHAGLKKPKSPSVPITRLHIHRQNAIEVSNTVSKTGWSRFAPPIRRGFRSPCWPCLIRRDQYRLVCQHGKATPSSSPGQRQTTHRWLPTSSKFDVGSLQCDLWELRTLQPPLGWWFDTYNVLRVERQRTSTYVYERIGFGLWTKAANQGMGDLAAGGRWFLLSQ